MSTFPTVVIEARENWFRVTQGGEEILRVHRDVFERFEADSVFPPQWTALQAGHPVRRLFWNPASREFLMAGLESHPARTAEALGRSSYREFLHSFWVPRVNRLYIRPFWRPQSPKETFGPEARVVSFETQLRFWGILAQLRPPTPWTAVLNATEAYLQAVGVLEPPPDETESSRVGVTTLPAPPPVGEDEGRNLLRRLMLDRTGEAFPVLTAGRLQEIHTLRERSEPLESTRFRDAATDGGEPSGLH